MSDPFQLTGMESLVDLAHPLTSKTPPYPGDPDLHIGHLATISEDGYLLSSVSSVFHTGTHVDAPGHFIEQGNMIDEMDLSTWYGHAVVLDVRGHMILEPRMIDPVRKVPADFILFRTGWDIHYGEGRYFQDHPVLAIDLAVELSNLPIKGIGLDFPSPDSYPYPVHQILLRHGQIIIENLTRLDQLPVGTLFPFMAFPDRIHAEAAWARPLAWINTKE